MKFCSNCIHVTPGEPLFFYSGLDFSMTGNGRHPNGTENSTTEFRDGHLELSRPSTQHDREDVVYAEYLKQGEGAKSAGLLIDSAEQSAGALRAAGLTINGSTPGTIILYGEKQPPRNGGSLSYLGPVPSRPLLMIQ